MTKIFFIILSAVSIMTVRAQNMIDIETGMLTKDISSTIPSRNIDISSDCVTVEYSIDSAIIQEDDLVKGCYWWKIEGFTLEDEPTKPSVLRRIDQFSIPDGKRAVLTVVDSSYREFPYRLSPARQPLTDSNGDVYTKENVLPIDKTIGVYPNEIACIDNVQTYRGHNILSIKVSPIQYDPVTETVRAYSKIVYCVTFVPDNKVTSSGCLHKPALAHDDNFLSNTTVLPIDQQPQLQSNPQSKPNNQDYLILTIDKYAAAVDTLAQWKRTLGFNVHVISKDSWASSKEVKRTIKDLYDRTPSLYYLLIVGDHEDVPSNISTQKHVTDFSYSCMDGDSDYTPDIYGGRLSVSNEHEALQVVEKIIMYERNPVTTESFYKKGLNCAHFEDKEEKYTYEDARFTLTSEEIRNYVQGQGKTIQRVYFASDDVTPRYWNQKQFSTGEAIPPELLKPAFAWDGDADDILKAINRGVFYVSYRGHGVIDGWYYPSFRQRNIASLSNCNKMPVIFSITCLTGKFNDNTCLAEAFLRKHNGGSVAVFAASEVSYSGYNDVLAGGMFDAIWPNPGLRIVVPGNKSLGNAPSPTYRLGQILNQGLTRVFEAYGIKRSKTRYTKEVFHCFGDPSMQIYTDTPTEFTGVTLKRESDKVRVELGDSNATISFHDLVTGDVKSYIGHEASYETVNPLYTTVCISAHNKKPYIDTGMTPTTEYIQNVTISGDISFEATCIKIGSNVNTVKEEGPVVFQNGSIILKAKEIEIESNTTISEQTTFETINQ